ncbi:MAG: TlpA family protein disulfide reductase [Flavobacteriia bacterium]
MPVQLRFFIGTLLWALPIFGQVQLRGLSFWNEPTLDIYQIDNHFSKEKKFLQRVSPDSMGIFNVQLDLQAISTLQICGSNKCAMLYAQPKGRYLIELPLEEAQTYYNQDMQEIELLFYQLDTTDINYRILGFEAWMDNYIADIYQLKDIRSNEFILKVLAFKAETAAVYGNETNAFLRDYIKYSVGLTIDNFSVVGGPSKEDKYEFYLQTDSVAYDQPKLIEYARLFYEAYDSQVDLNVRNAVQIALQANSLDALIAALRQDPYIYNSSWAEFVALQLIIESEQSKRIAKDLSLALLRSLSIQGTQVGLREAARFQLQQLSKLSDGEIWDAAQLSKEFGFSIASQQYVYLHHYIPGNQKCIAEMAALKRLAERYKNKVQIITFYPSELTWTTADNRAFDGAKWQRVALPSTAETWTQFSWTSAPAYILLDPQLKVLYLNALGPLPNARTQTIDLIFSQLLGN